MRILILLAFLLLLPGSGLASEAEELVLKKGCVVCHDVNVKKVGPSFKEMAKKYSKQDMAKLTERIRKGSQGVWGPVPMPPQAVTEPEAKEMVEWVLSLQ